MTSISYHYTFSASLSAVFGIATYLTNRNFETIPSELDPVTTSLQLNYNLISRVEKNSFLGLSQLYDIHMNENDIYFIDDEAFLPCSLILLLNLQCNKLTILPEMSTLRNRIYLEAKENDIYSDQLFQ